MNYQSLTSNEKTIFDRFTEEEKAVYLANTNSLMEMSSLFTTGSDGRYQLKQFIDISMMMIALNRQQNDYSDLTDYLLTLPNNTDERQKSLT